MKIITDNAEQAFAAMLERLAVAPAEAAGLYFARGADMTAGGALCGDPAALDACLRRMRAESDDFVAALATRAGELDAEIYHFADGDAVLMAAADDRDRLESLRIADELSVAYEGAADLPAWRQTAARKMLSALRVKAYRLMTDGARMAAIGPRRDRRKDGVVLLVEDDRYTASFAASILNRHYDLIHAQTGEDALIAYIEHAPDVVLLDIHLPGMDGHHVLQVLRAFDPEAAVVMVSADTVKANIVDAAAGGALGFLKKPFSGQRLRAAILKSPHMRGSKIARRR